MDEKYVSVSELRKLLGIPSDGQCTGCQFSTFHGCKDDSIQRACEAIDDAPEADVRPVVRGHYIGEYDGFADGAPVYDIWTCSACGHQFDECDEEPTYDFCPYCGADMGS